MAKTAVVTTRIEPELKQEVEEVLAELGISTSQAVLLYFKQIVRQRGIPFTLELGPKQSDSDFLLSLAGSVASGEQNNSENAQDIVTDFILQKHSQEVS